MIHELSIAFQTDKPISAYGALAQLAEAQGFDVVTVYNDLLYQPAWLPLMEIARTTKRVRLGVAAVNPFTCHPINIAGNIALIDEASGGRAYLGIARGAWLDYLGLEPKQPVTAIRESIGCVRHLLSRSREPYAGKMFSLAGGETLRWNILRPDIPILLGAWGEAVIRACLPYVSEIKLGGTANPALVQLKREFLDDACRAIGRDPQSVGIVVGAVSVVDRDGDKARALAKREVALYLPVVADLDATVTLETNWSAALENHVKSGDREAAARLISDDLLQKFAFAGTPEQIAAQTAALFQAGASRVEFGTPHGLDKLQGIELLGEVVSHVR